MDTTSDASAMARIIDGKAIAASLRAEVAGEVATLVARARRASRASPWCWSATIRPARSMCATRRSRRAEVGMRSFEHPAAGDDRRRPSCSTRIARLNADPPSTASWCSCRCRRRSTHRAVIERDRPGQGRRRLPPGQRRAAASRGCRGSCRARRSAACSCSSRARRSLAGCDAVVVGRSNIVGKPMAQLLLRENCTVTIAHSRTRDLAGDCRRADIARRGGRPAAR